MPKIENPKIIIDEKEIDCKPSSARYKHGQIYIYKNLKLSVKAANSPIGAIKIDWRQYPDYKKILLKYLYDNDMIERDSDAPYAVIKELTDYRPPCGSYTYHFWIEK